MLEFPIKDAEKSPSFVALEKVMLNPTICANCIHVEITGTKVQRWKCAAPWPEKGLVKLDLVTGRRHGPYPVSCREKNNGNCRYYREKK